MEGRTGVRGVLAGEGKGDPHVLKRVWRADRPIGDEGPHREDS